MTTRAKAEARKARAIEREKGFKMNPAEIPNMADALFGSGRDESVEMYAGPKGREIIQRLFPNLVITVSGPVTTGRASGPQTGKHLKSICRLPSRRRILNRVFLT